MSDLHTLKRPASVDVSFVQRAAFQPPIRHEQHLVITDKPFKAQHAEHFQELAIGIDDSNTNGKEDHGALAYTTTIEVQEGATATVVVRYFEQASTLSKISTSALLSTSLELRLAEDTQLTLFVLSSLPRHYFRESFDHAQLGRHSRLTWTILDLDQCEGIYTTIIDLEGTQSELDLAGAYGASGTTAQEHITSIHHYAPFTTSTATFKSALKNSSRLISVVLYKSIHTPMAQTRIFLTAM